MFKKAIKTRFEEFEKVCIPAKGITGTIVDIYKGDDGIPCYLVKNDVWGDVEDIDAWNIGYAFFDCTAAQIVKVESKKE